MSLSNVLLTVGLALLLTPLARAQAPDAPPALDQVMAIPEPLREAFRAEVIDTTNAPERRLRRMVDFMFDEDGLGLQYQADATSTVAESFRTRRVNCLSFALMAVALAREAGLDARGQQINRIMATNLIGDTVMQSMHVNAVVTLQDRNLMVKDGRDFVLDISSDQLYTRGYIVHGYKIGDDALLASFYSNRAMDLLAAGDAEGAKNWLDVALALSPDDAVLWDNAGLLSQRVGDSAAAERWFLRAARKSPHLTSALFNLVALYDGRGDATRAAFWRDRADRVLRNDPWYQFALGESMARSRDLDGAIRHYRRAISLDRDEQLFHFGLARAYLEAGKLASAGAQLQAARDLSRQPEDRRRFQAKLDVLKAIAAH